MSQLFEIVDPYRAVSSRPWPGEAGVYISVIHLSKGGWRGQHYLDDVEVEGISTMLQSGQTLAEPFALSATKYQQPRSVHKHRTQNKDVL